MADPHSPENPVTQRAFTDVVLNPESALATAIEFIGDNLNPGDVFSDEKLVAWAKTRGFPPLPIVQE